MIDAPKELHLHYIFWDFDKGTLPEIIQLLRKIQKEFHLGDIFIISDKAGSYRAICWSKREWTTYLHILLHSEEYLDCGFFVWPWNRKAATIRYSRKTDRPLQKIVQVLHGYEPAKTPEESQLRFVKYDTGIEKRGRLIELG